MKSFLVKSLVLFIAVMLLFKVLDKMAVSGLSKLQDDDFKDLHMLYNNQIEDDMLILGSSRSWNHFNIREIEKITNIKSRVVGLSGADYYMQRTLWEPVLNSDNAIKYIVHVVGALECGQRSDGIFKKYKFLPYLDNKYVYTNLSNSKDDLWKDRYIPLYKFHGSYKYFIKGIVSNLNIGVPEPYTKYKGFQGFDENWNGEIDVDAINIPESNIMASINYIRLEAQLARKKDKVLVLVYTPESIETKSIFTKRKRVIEDLKKVEADFDNVYFLNYVDWYGNSNHDLFKDPIHLNSKGAKLFSQTFAEDVLKIINLNKAQNK